MTSQGWDEVEAARVARQATLRQAPHAEGEAPDFQNGHSAIVEQLVLDPSDPLPSARTYLRARHLHQDVTILCFHNGDFFRWDGAAYVEMETNAIRAEVYALLDRAKRRTETDKLGPFKPTSSRVNDVVDALKASAHLPASFAAPAWLDGRTDPEPREVVACRNGLLHIRSGQLLPPSSAFFTLNATAFDYNADAPAPAEWLEFLHSLWGEDGEAIAALQEAFGYLLTPDTRHHKAFLLVGPRRSGKGTIARILKALVGPRNVAAPTLAALGTNFGCAPLIGKSLAIIGDARLSGRVDQHAIVERILSISGEDVQTVDRKHREAWTGSLPTRFLVLSNELPRLSDTSGAIASRFIVLTLTKSFLGNEDHDLERRLMLELPGILNWALDGLRRLRERGYFLQPTSSAEAIQELEDLGSPIGAFIRDRCIVECGRSVPCDTLFANWKLWCEAQNRDRPGTVQAFGRDLRTVLPAIKTVSLRTGLGRVRTYEGIGLA